MNQDVIAKANRSERELIETQEVVASLRAGIIEKWAATGIDAVDTREKLYAHYNALNAILAALQASVTSGIVERANAETAEILRPARR